MYVRAQRNLELRDEALPFVPPHASSSTRQSLLLMSLICLGPGTWSLLPPFTPPEQVVKAYLEDKLIYHGPLKNRMGEETLNVRECCALCCGTFGP